MSYSYIDFSDKHAFICIVDEEDKRVFESHVYTNPKCIYGELMKSGYTKKQTICLGRLDPETGELIPSKPRVKRAERAIVAPGVTAVSQVAGPYLLLEKISHQHELDRLLKQCFSDKWQLIQFCLFYRPQEYSAHSAVGPPGQ